MGSTECISTDSTLQLFDRIGQADNWRWTGPNGFTSNEQNPILASVNTNVSGTYVLVASSGNCITTDSITVEITGALPTPIIEPINLSCTDDTLTLRVMGSYQENVKFLWNSLDTNLISSTITTDTANLMLRPRDTLIYTVTVQAIDGACVSSLDTITFQPIQSPMIDLSTIETEYICIVGDSLIQLNETGGEGAKWNWQGPDGFGGDGSPNPTFVVNYDNAQARSGRYFVTVLGENGCEATDFIDLDFTQGIPKLTIEGPSSFCVGEDILLRAIGNVPENVEYLWTAPTDTISATSGNGISLEAVELLAGGYTVKAISKELGCASEPSDTFLVTIVSKPKLNPDQFIVSIDQLDTLDVLVNDSLLSTIPITYGLSKPAFLGTVNIDDLGVLTYRPNTGVTGNDNFTYEVCYTGCADSTIVLCELEIANITIQYPEEECVITNLVTPNEDGKNDLLIVTCATSDLYPNNELTIFNEWGDEVFRASPYKNDWGGTYNDKPLPDGTYFYIFTTGGSEEVQKGFITLYR